MRWAAGKGGYGGCQRLESQRSYVLKGIFQLIIDIDEFLAILNRNIARKLSITMPD